MGEFNQRSERDSDIYFSNSGKLSDLPMIHFSDMVIHHIVPIL